MGGNGTKFLKYEQPGKFTINHWNVIPMKMGIQY